MTQGFNDNLYLIDLSYLNTPAEVVYDLSSILDTEPAKNQRVKLKLGSIDFNKSQLLSIKSLIESINSTLAIVDGKSEVTRNSAIATGIVYQNSVDMVQESEFFNSENIETEEKTYEEVTPQLFPDVSPVKETQEEENQEENQNNTENTNTFSQEFPDSGESFSIEPPKFETSEENLNFEQDNDTWLDTEEKSPVENLQEQFSNDNWSNSSENNENNNNNENQNITDKVNKLFDSEEQNDFAVMHNENNNEQITEEVHEEEQKPEEPGIQSLADIPLDVPSEKTIQEELDVIYNTERKLDGLFAATGLKEEKFRSLKDVPKAEEQEYTQYDFELEAFPTKYLKQTICTGQYISFDGNLVIIGDCHEGSEISASGDITVWGELSGSAHAGKNGNEKCKIRALKMNASQLRISNCYIKRPSVLNDATKVDNVPTEATILNGEIAVYKIYK